MNVLVTGAGGFVGKNLVENLKNIRDGKNHTRPNIHIDEIFECHTDTTPEELCAYCGRADFVFSFAGVNRSQDPHEFRKGNLEFAATLLGALKARQNSAPVMFASSVWAMLSERCGGEYGRTKKSGEELFFRYAEETSTKVLVYRLPNLAGKWCRPNYNSVVATFCNNIANDLPIVVHDPSTELELLFIQDLIEEMFDALEGNEHHCEFDGPKAVPCPSGRYCYVPLTYRVTLGRIVELLNAFYNQPQTLLMPNIPPDSFEKKLYSMYVSYLPKRKVVFSLNSKLDERGSFTELLKTVNCGQFSVNVSKPGATKGQHWHNNKWELFVVVSGRALIRERKIGTDEVWEFEVSGDKIEAVHMLPGYAHSIVNLSQTDNLVTLMWANECIDSAQPDTFWETV